MRTVNLHEAKTHLSRLVARAAGGESFIIAKAGKPLVKVIPLEPKDAAIPNRLGFLQGEFQVPADFDKLGGKEIEHLFGGKS